MPLEKGTTLALRQPAPDPVLDAVVESIGGALENDRAVPADRRRFPLGGAAYEQFFWVDVAAPGFGHPRGAGLGVRAVGKAVNCSNGAGMGGVIPEFWHEIPPRLRPVLTDELFERPVLLAAQCVPAPDSPVAQPPVMLIPAGPEIERCQTGVCRDSTHGRQVAPRALCHHPRGFKSLVAVTIVLGGTRTGSAPRGPGARPRRDCRRPAVSVGVGVGGRSARRTGRVANS